jgi:hypothetical protein
LAQRQGKLIEEGIFKTCRSNIKKMFTQPGIRKTT